jgi:tetratricopeptide (TPR) repeat protein
VSCWEIQFQLTGEVAELPADAFGESDSEKTDSIIVRGGIAKVLARSGRLAEATKFLPKDEANLATVLILAEFHLLVAEAHAQRGHRQQATLSLQRGWTLVQRLPDFGKMERSEAIGKLWLQLGDRPQALAAQDAALKRLRDRSTKEKPNKSLALDWARAGKLQALLGQDERAREAFREALRQAHAVDQSPKDEDFRDEDLRADDYIETVGQIGAWQSLNKRRVRIRQGFRAL